MAVAVFELCVVAVWCQRAGMHDDFSKSGGGLSLQCGVVSLTGFAASGRCYGKVNTSGGCGFRVACSVLISVCVCVDQCVCMC